MLEARERIPQVIFLLTMHFWRSYCRALLCGMTNLPSSFIYFQATLIYLLVTLVPRLQMQHYTLASLHILVVRKYLYAFCIILLSWFTRDFFFRSTYTWTYIWSEINWCSYCRDARVMWDQQTGRSRGFGFVSFRNQQAWNYRLISPICPLFLQPLSISVCFPN